MAENQPAKIKRPLDLPIPVININRNDFYDRATEYIQDPIPLLGIGLTLPECRLQTGENRI